LSATRNGSLNNLSQFLLLKISCILDRVSAIQFDMDKYGIFIIESLRSEDDYFDGENLHNILKLAKIDSIYHEVLSLVDFIDKIEKFVDSGYRYLHLSCHGDESGIEINGEKISNGRLIEIFNGRLFKKRLFMSACQGANKELGYNLITKVGATSLIGTPINLGFDKAALFWPSFYYAVNEADNKKMQAEKINLIIRRCVQLFNIPIDYYSAVKNHRNRILLFKFRKGKNLTCKKIEIKKTKKL
jgi:hypothetical protein